MRVEILEERLSDEHAESGRHYLHVKGDVVTVPDDLGLYWLSHGWAKDVDGEHETAERVVVGETLISPKSAAHTPADTQPRRRAGRNG